MFDVLIIGLGAAGYTAAIYTARYRLKTMLVGLEEGGLGITAAEVGNWPGDIEIKGPELMEKFKKHVASFPEVTQKIGKVSKIEKVKGGFRATFQSGETAEAKAIILATGSNKRHLNVPGEDTYAGRGVTYCATCDAFFYRGKTVAVVGGGDSAVEGAAITAQVAKTVYLIHRRNEFRAEPYWLDRVKARENIVPVLERNVEEILGSAGEGPLGGKVTGVRLSAPFQGKDILPVDGVFIEVGASPAADLAKELGCALDERGFLRVGAGMQSSVPGVFGAGDVTSASNHFAQFVTAAGEGAVAANSVFSYVSTAGGGK